MLREVLQVTVILMSAMLYQAVMHRQGWVVTRAHRRWTLALVLYLWVLVMGSRLTPLCTAGGWIRQWVGVWFVPQAAVVVMVALELVCMAPLGFLVPHIWREFTSWIEVGFVGYVFAILLELAQLPTHRMVAVSDVLLASAGTVLGFLFWQAIGYYFFCGRVSERQRSVGRWEPFVYLGLSASGCFLFYNWHWFA